MAKYKKEQETLVDNSVIGRIKNMTVSKMKKMTEIPKDSPKTTMTPLKYHQILPSLKWNNNLPLAGTDIFYAIRAYYVRPDKSEKTVYLAWDLDKTETEHHYRVFPSYRDKQKDEQITTFKYGTEGGIYNEKLTSNVDTNKTVLFMDKKFYNLDGRDCEESEKSEKSAGTGTNLMDSNVEKISIEIPDYNRYASYTIDGDEIKKTDGAIIINSISALNLSENQRNKLDLGQLNNNPLEVVNGYPFIVYNLNGITIGDLKVQNFEKR